MSRWFSVKVSSKKLILLSIIVAIVYVVFGLHVSNDITNDDYIAIGSLQTKEYCQPPFRNYKDELKCIKRIQAEIQKIGLLKCTERGVNIEPLDFINRNYGCCSARARFIQKALRSIGFETRQVFLIQPYRGISATNLFPLGQISHATTEVLTKRGWMGVDSNESFILLDEDSNPYTYKEGLTNKFVRMLMTPVDYYSGKIDVIYGLYSRHGFFWGTDFPGPEFYFSEILWNFRE